MDLAEGWWCGVAWRQQLFDELISGTRMFLVKERRVVVVCQKRLRLKSNHGKSFGFGITLFRTIMKNKSKIGCKHQSHNNTTKMRARKERWDRPRGR
jgi:hypothetical protein